jgi:hypothetical protein
LPFEHLCKSCSYYSFPLLFLLFRVSPSPSNQAAAATGSIIRQSIIIIAIVRSKYTQTQTQSCTYIRIERRSQQMPYYALFWAVGFSFSFPLALIMQWVYSMLANSNAEVRIVVQKSYARANVRIEILFYALYTENWALFWLVFFVPCSQVGFSHKTTFSRLYPCTLTLSGTERGRIILRSSVLAIWDTLHIQKHTHERQEKASIVSR